MRHYYKKKKESELDILGSLVIKDMVNLNEDYNQAKDDICKSNCEGKMDAYAAVLEIINKLQRV